MNVSDTKMTIMVAAMNAAKAMSCTVLLSRNVMPGIKKEFAPCVNTARWA
jgi:hypothetical protein